MWTQERRWIFSSASWQSRRAWRSNTESRKPPEGGRGEGQALKRDDGLKIIEPWPLKPDTPWYIRRRIRKLEHEIDRCWVWVYRASLALEMVIAALVVLCITHCTGLLQTM